jgi:hypothetical protein
MGPPFFGLAFGFLIASAAPVGVQCVVGSDGPAVAKPSAGLSLLLLDKRVQDELNLDRAQKAGLGQLLRSVAEKHQGDVLRLRNLKGRERTEKFRVLEATVAEETQDRLQALLRPEQNQRWQQIQLQQLGPQAFFDPKLQAALKLSAAQLERIRLVGGATLAAASEVTQNAAGSGKNELAQQLIQLRDRALADILELLTPEQRQTWEGMTGKPFALDAPRDAAPPEGSRKKAS